MATYGIERDTLKNFTNGYGVTAFSSSVNSDIIALFSKPLEPFRISWSGRPSGSGAVTAIDAKLMGSIDGTTFDILVAEMKHTDTSGANQSGWSSATGETFHFLQDYVKFLQVQVASITTTGSIAFALLVN